MAEAFLDTLLEVQPKDLANASKECCICLEEIEVKPQTTNINERPVRLPCAHIVHTICIAKWLSTNQGHNTCPMCRHTLFTTVKPPSAIEAETAAARRELQAFYGTNQLIQRGVNGEPDLYDEGQMFTEPLYPEDWDMNDGQQFFRRRLTLPNPADPPRTTKEARRRRVRNLVEISTYRQLRFHHPHMPPAISGKELSPSNVEALYTTLSSMGVFNQLWGPRTTTTTKTKTKGPSRRQMFALMRDSGYAYQWREGLTSNCWRRVGWRQPGRLRDASSLSANARALLVREPLPDQATIRAARREEQRVAGDEAPLVGRMLQNSQASPARRLMQWYRRHWWRGFAIN